MSDLQKYTAYLYRESLVLRVKCLECKREFIFDDTLNDQLEILEGITHTDTETVALNRRCPNCGAEFDIIIKIHRLVPLGKEFLWNHEKNGYVEKVQAKDVEAMRDFVFGKRKS
jgi:DNA-directed RNA polymerase subunit RPC12/RpoP